MPQSSHTVDYLPIYDLAFRNESYNNHETTPWRWTMAIEKILEKIERFWIIADLGTGRGGFVRKLIEETEHWLPHITCSDLKDWHGIKVSHRPLDLSVAPSEMDHLPWYSHEAFEAVTCLDVLEHLDERGVENALKILSTMAAFESNELILISVSNHEEVIDGQELHFTQEDGEWWTAKSAKRLDIVQSKKDGVSWFFVCKGKR